MMIQRIRTFLNQPYRFYLKGKSLLYFIGFIFLMGFCFVYMFQPFEVNPAEHKMTYFWISIIHALVSVIGIGIAAFVLMLFVKDDSVWKVKHEMILVIFLFLLIGIGQFLIRDIIYDNPRNWSLEFFVEEIRNTFMVGLLFCVILVPLNYMRLLKLQEGNARRLSVPQEVSFDSKITQIAVKTKLKSDDFQLNLAEFIAAKAEGNYVQLYLKTETGVQTSLKRMTIKELEQQLKDVRHIFKSHRSYIINLSLVEKVNGNAQGYRVGLSELPNDIPVSRNMIPAFESKLQQMSGLSFVTNT